MGIRKRLGIGIEGKGREGRREGRDNLASTRREPTATILLLSFSMTMVKYESFRLRSHSNRSTISPATTQPK
jgi:hypothetical protein